MTLLETLDRDLIKVPLSSADGSSVIDELVGLYAAKQGLLQAEASSIAAAVKAREALGSTAMENGIAIPHAKLHGLARNAVVIGISRIPVPFGGKEGTRVFFLVLARDDSPAEHIQLLSSIAKVASSQLFVRMLLSSKTPQDVYQLFFE